MLSDEHKAYLAARAITDESIIAARGYETVERGLKMPIYALPDGLEAGYEIRLDSPTKSRKFDRPKGSVNHLNVSPANVDAVRDVSRPLWIVEGTTRADALAQRGFAAASINGVWGWKAKDQGSLSDFHDVPFKNRIIIFGPDADYLTNPNVNKAVREFAAFVARKGGDMRVISLPDGQGIDDYLAAGNSADSLFMLLRHGDEIPEIATPKVTRADFPADTSDEGLALEWVRDNQDAKYLHARDGAQWVVFDGRKWTDDNKTRSLARGSLGATLRRLVEQADSWASDEGSAEAAKTAAAIRHDLLSSTRRNAVVSIAESLKEFTTNETEFIEPPNLINVSNGTLSLDTGELLPHAPELMQRRISPASWRPDTKPGAWQHFLDQILSADKQEYLQRYFGAALYGEPLEQILPILHGRGANGKSVMINTISRVLGSDYAAPVDPALLLKNSRQDHQTNLMAMNGRRLVTIEELESSDKLKSAFLKRFTGDDNITARGIGKDQTEFKPTHNLVMMTNNLPEIDDNSDGIWRRIVVIPFDVQILPEHQDKTLGSRLVNEHADEVFKWLVDGFTKWRRNGLPECTEIVLATLNYQMQENTFNAFATERLNRDPKGVTPRADVARAFQEWSAENPDAKPLTPRDLVAAMKQYGATETKYGGVRMWRGVTILGALWGTFGAAKNEKVPQTKTPPDQVKQVSNPPLGALGALFSEFESVADFPPAAPTADRLENLEKVPQDTPSEPVSAGQTPSELGALLPPQSAPKPSDTPGMQHESTPSIVHVSPSVVGYRAPTPAPVSFANLYRREEFEPYWRMPFGELFHCLICGDEFQPGNKSAFYGSTCPTCTPEEIPDIDEPPNNVIDRADE